MPILCLSMMEYVISGLCLVIVTARDLLYAGCLWGGCWGDRRGAGSRFFKLRSQRREHDKLTLGEMAKLLFDLGWLAEK